MFDENDDADDESDQQRGEPDVRTDGVNERDRDGSRGCAGGDNAVSDVVSIHRLESVNAPDAAHHL